MSRTYEPIATTTLGSAAFSLTFSSISANYTDLVCVLSGQVSASGRVVKITFNGDSSSGLYSMTELWGTGSTVGSARRTGQNQIETSYSAVNFGDTGISNVIIHFMNYSNTNVNKTIISRTNATSATFPGVVTNVGLWRNTNAINSVTIEGNNFNSGTVATLYGIKAA